MPGWVAIGLICAGTLLTILCIAWYIIAPPMKHKRTASWTGVYFGLLGNIQFAEDVLYRIRNRFPIPDASDTRARKVAIVTGAGRGIGLEVTRILMKSGMTVVMAVRRPGIVLEKAEEFMKEFPHAKADVFELDTSVIQSIHSFAKAVTSKYPEITVLVNNAGIYDSTRRTVNGFNMCFGTNYLGHLYLTHLLLPSLRLASKESQFSRVVNVSCGPHAAGVIKFEDINLHKNHEFGIAYAQSKVAQLMFTRTLERLLNRQNDRVHAYCVDPGICFTEMVANLAPKVLHNLLRRIYKSAKQGATSVAYCCLSPKVETKGGKHFANCGEIWSSRYSRDILKQQELFSVSCKMVEIEENDFGNSGLLQKHIF